MQFCSNDIRRWKNVHVVSNDDFFLLHRVGVTRAETDKVLCGEVMQFPDYRRNPLSRNRHKLKSNKLAFTWKSDIRIEIFLPLMWKNFKVQFNQQKQKQDFITSPSVEMFFTWQLSQTTVKTWQLFSAVVGKKTTCKHTGNTQRAV